MSDTTPKKALITGLTGQDGSYLAELLLKKGYAVHGLMRRSSSFNTGRIEHIFQDPHEEGKRLTGDFGDLTDGSSLNRLIEKVKPDEIYNLGAQSHVKVSFSLPEYTSDTVALGTLRLLDAVRDTGLRVKFYQAGSSEMFGKVLETPQKETTPFYPRSPYGCAKVFAHHLAVNYREAYGMFICNGILFNHESPRRGGTFVTKKIVRGLSQIKAGKQDKVYLGNLEARRDWGFAKDYVEAMWLMLQQPEPDDYIVATGKSHSVREFAEEAAKHFDYELKWEGEGLEEKGVDVKTSQVLIAIDPEYFRPSEVEFLLGDATKAEKKLGWKPKVTFKELVALMCDAEKNPSPLN